MSFWLQLKRKGALLGAPFGWAGKLPAHAEAADQFRDLSTILPLEIQGIMARSFSPTCLDLVFVVDRGGSP